MSFLSLSGQLVAGLRIALILFAVMSLLAVHADAREEEALGWHRKRAWLMISLAVVIYSPAHAAWAMGHAPPDWVARVLDVLTTAAACISFIHLLAARGLALGLSAARVRRGVITNLGVMVAIVGAACLIP